MLGGGGAGSLDDHDYSLRGLGGKHQNYYILYEYFCITNLKVLRKNSSFNELYVAYDT